MNTNEVKIQLPLVFDGPEAEGVKQTEDRYGVTVVKALQPATADLDEYVVAGGQAELLKFLVDYASNVVVDGVSHLNLEEFLHHMMDLKPRPYFAPSPQVAELILAYQVLDDTISSLLVASGDDLKLDGFTWAEDLRNVATTLNRVADELDPPDDAPTEQRAE